MKIKCVKCQTEETLNEEDVKLLGHIVKRYNSKPNPNDYTAVLSVIKGECTDGKKHLFVYHESFDDEVSNLIQEYNGAIASNVARKQDLEKIVNQIFEINNQIKVLESTLKDCEKKKEFILAELSAGGILIDNIRLQFEKMTGSDNISLWS